MYYSGTAIPAAGQNFTGNYQLGHATSNDGINWAKDPANPIITPEPDFTRWGSFTTAEPAVLYRTGVAGQADGFLLYYVSTKSNAETMETAYGILLATSADGSTFEHRTDLASGEKIPVLTLGEGYPDSVDGYSTPGVVLDRFNAIHLFHSIVDTANGFHLVALAHQKSFDGVTFTEVERNLLTAGGGDWKNRQVRAPTVLFEPGQYKMWFGGESANAAGIGYATFGGDCP